jgi:hypothetical protein
MAWERFQYLCRAALAKSKDGSLSESIDQLNTKPSADLYGKLPSDSLPMSLLDSAKRLNDADQVNLALKTYAKLDATYLVDKPRNMKRLPIYLLWIVSTYTLMISIYKLKIFPMFETMYEVAGWHISSETLFFIEYGSTLGYLFGLLLLVLVAAVFGLNRLVSFKKDYSESVIVKRFCPAFVKKPYANLIGILRYPVLMEQGVNDGINSAIKNHFDDVTRSDLGLQKEICALFSAEANRLVRRCEIIAKAVSIFAALVVFFSVYQFVYSFYLPIFSLGATL